MFCFFSWLQISSDEWQKTSNFHNSFSLHVKRSLLSTKKQISCKGSMTPHGLHQHFHHILVLPSVRQFPPFAERCFFVMPCRQRFQDQVRYTQPRGGSVGVVSAVSAETAFLFKNRGGWVGGQQIVKALGDYTTCNRFCFICKYLGYQMSNWKVFETQFKQPVIENMLWSVLYMYVS